MRTINQVNAFVDRNQTLLYYKRENYKHYNVAIPYNHYCHRDFQFRHGGYRWRCSPLGTFIYDQAKKYLYDYCGLKEKRSNESSPLIRRVSYTLPDDAAWEWTLRIEINFWGVWFTAESWHARFTPEHIKIKLRSNQSFEEFDLVGYFEREILPKYLYKEGFFRELQLIHNWKKKEAQDAHREAWANIIAAMKKPQRETHDVYKAVYRHLRRKWNIDVQDFDAFSVTLKELLNLKRKYTPFKHRMILHTFPSFDYFETDGDIDEVETEFWEVMNSYPPNTLFV